MYSRGLVVEGGSVAELEWRRLEREIEDTHTASQAGNGGSYVCGGYRGVLIVCVCQLGSVCIPV